MVNKKKLLKIKKEFEYNGFVKVKLFRKSEFKIIIKEAAKLIKDKIENKKISNLKNWRDEDYLNQGLVKLDKKNHKNLVEIYNQLPKTTQIFKIISDERIIEIIQTLLNTKVSSNFYTDSLTIRMDTPNKKKYLYGFHKDRITAIKNSDFIQLWAPIFSDITNKLGGLIISERSHNFKGKIVTDDDFNQIKNFNQTKITRAKFSSKLSKFLKKNKQKQLTAQLGEFIFFSPDSQFN